MMALISLPLVAVAAYFAATPDVKRPDPSGVRVRAYVDCLARRAPNDVGEVLDQAIGPDLDEPISKLSVKKCPPAPREGVSSTKLRTAIFAGMFRRFSARAGRAAGTMVWEPRLPASHPLAGWYLVTSCLVRVEPNVVRDWLGALPGTKKAMESFDSILTALPRCLPSGQQFKFDRALFESLLAETLYRVEFAGGGRFQ